MESRQPPAFSLRIPQGDNRERQVCDTCGFVDYENPKVVVGSVVTYEGRYLLGRRSIEPRSGYWTIPAGYLEDRESTEEGARREAREEMCAEIDIDCLLGIYEIPRISQVQLIFRARLIEGRFAAGDETLEADLFEWDRIPWGEIAFPTVEWALRDHRDTLGRAGFAPARRSVDGRL